MIPLRLWRASRVRALLLGVRPSRGPRVAFPAAFAPAPVVAPPSGPKRRGRPRKSAAERKSVFHPSGGPLHRLARISGGRGGLVLEADHPAVVAARPLFPSTVVAADASPRLLVSGMNQRKIGARVTKGAWKDLPIFTLTLPERSSCPAPQADGTGCAQWLTCYGNNMPFARRHRLDDATIARLERELALAAAHHPKGFVVRVHVLGDFGSLDDEPLALRYLAMWEAAFETLPGLHAFGFTAHDPDGEIGSTILGMNLSWPERCRIRFSGTADEEGFGALVIATPADSRHVRCPAQIERADGRGATDCCGTCGLCWTMRRTVEFVRH